MNDEIQLALWGNDDTRNTTRKHAPFPEDFGNNWPNRPGFDRFLSRRWSDNGDCFAKFSGQAG